MSAISTHNHHDVLDKLVELYQDVYGHDGYGEIRVEVRIQRRGQKEVILHCGKQYRYVLDFNPQLKSKLMGQFEVIDCAATPEKKIMDNVDRARPSDLPQNDIKQLSAKQAGKMNQHISPTMRQQCEQSQQNS